MTGLKSGSGDDLWGDDGDDDTDADDAEVEERGTTDHTSERPERASPVSPEDAGSEGDAGSTNGTDSDDARSSDDAESDSDADPPAESTAESSATATDTSDFGLDLSTTEFGQSSNSQSYIVRRAVQDKSVQFERDERLTFFVHDDVADGERDLITELQSALGRDVPKFDVREAVYRAALQNPNDVLAELLKMGYSIDEE